MPSLEVGRGRAHVITRGLGSETVSDGLGREGRARSRGDG